MSRGAEHEPGAVCCVASWQGEALGARGAALQCEKPTPGHHGRWVTGMCGVLTTFSLVPRGPLQQAPRWVLRKVSTSAAVQLLSPWVASCVPTEAIVLGPSV